MRRTVAYRHIKATSMTWTEKKVTPMKWEWLLNPPKIAGSVSLLAGYVAGEACSLYAIFIAHTMNPVSYRLVENDQNLRAIYGRYQEIYNMDGLLFTLAASCVAFAIALCAVRGIAFTMTGSEAKPRRVTMRQRIPESSAVGGLGRVRYASPFAINGQYK
jgi:hypothetical protein